jgi:hypothetical protein
VSGQRTEMTDKIQAGTRELRNFGLLLGALFILIFAGLPLLRHRAHPIWPWFVAGGLWTCALLVPLALRPVHGYWTQLGKLLGWVNTRLILSLLYAVAVVPIGLVMRLFGRDPMERKFNPAAETYRVPSRERPASHLERPY